MPRRSATLCFVRKPGSTEYYATPATVRTLSSAEEEFRAKLGELLAQALAQPDVRAHLRQVAANPKLAKRHARMLRSIRVHFPDVLDDDTNDTEPR